MPRERGTPRYLKIAQDICGKILTGEYKAGTLLKGRSILGASYGVSPETVRKALNLLEKERVVSSKRGVGVFVESVPHAQQFATRWRSETQIQNKYRELETLLEQKKELDQKINTAISDMNDSFRYQTTTEAVQFLEITIPKDCWIDGKPLGEVHFWNHTEATIVAVIDSEGITKSSPGPGFILHSGDRLLFVGKDSHTFDKVNAFLTHGTL